MENMDWREQAAFDLEVAQEKRYRKAARNHESFWSNVEEREIFDLIKYLRTDSKTYSPLNER